MEIAITAGSGSIVLLLLSTILQGFRKHEKFANHPWKLVAIVAPFMVLAMEPFLPESPVGYVIRLAGSGMFVYLILAVIVAAKKHTNWHWTDYVVTGAFGTVSVLGAVWLLSRALH